MDSVSPTCVKNQNTILSDLRSTLENFPRSPLSVNAEPPDPPVVLRVPATGPTTQRSPSLTSSYCDEWERLFDDESSSETMIACLREAGLQGEMMNSRFRSICWRIYLGVLSTDKSCWVEETQCHRNKYEKLKHKFVIDPRSTNDDETSENPLSQDECSVWNRFFVGSESKRQIHQDVVRTFPEVEFFHGEAVRASMVNVLFCFSQVSLLGYKQGMHEVLAPLIFVLHCDHLAYQHTSELGTMPFPLSEIANKLLDPQFLEHDAFALFVQIMEIIGPWYDVKEGRSQESTPEPFQRPTDTAAISCDGVARLNYIRDTLLRNNDLELYLHLEKLEIVAQMYGLRWIRLLFGREFTLQDLLVVWDSLFALHENFILVDYIFVAMLIQVRDILLKSDFSEALCLLMRYPPGVDARHIVSTALHLYKPLVYSKPAEQVYQPIFFSKNQKRSRKVQRNRTSIGLDMLTSRFKNVEIFQRFQGMSFSGLMRGNDQMERPSSLLNKPSIKVRHHSSVERCAYPKLSGTREMESAPVTPTQGQPERTQSSISNFCHGSNASSNFQEFVEIRLPHERKAEANTLMELLKLCSFCYSELDICIEMVRNSIEDCRNRQPWSTSMPEHISQQIIDDTAKLKTTLDKLTDIRDLLGGVNSQTVSPQIQNQKTTLPRSLSSHNLSSHSSFSSPGRSCDSTNSRQLNGNDVELQDFTPKRRVVWDE